MLSCFPKIENISKTSGPFISPTIANRSGIITFPNPIFSDVIHPFTLSEIFPDENSSISLKMDITFFNKAGVSALNAFSDAFSS